MKENVKNIPILGNLIGQIYRQINRNRTRPQPFSGSGKYWEERYAAGGNSGVGSYNKFAEFKADILNMFVAEHDIQSVIEFGCGDGNQLDLAVYPRYLGFDVSDTAIDLCRKRFATDSSKTFESMRKYNGEISDLTLSLDVIYHLVEDEVFEKYIRDLFDAATRYVVIYSSNYEENIDTEITHVRNRKFTQWIEENLAGWSFKEHIPNRYPYQGDYKIGSIADFYIYEKA